MINGEEFQMHQSRASSGAPRISDADWAVFGVIYSITVFDSAYGAPRYKPQQLAGAVARDRRAFVSKK